MMNEHSNIRIIIKSLSKPDAYTEVVKKISVIQTHVSVIFVTDKYVYKIKKPVDFGFLNFKSIDRRRFYCNEEVRLNRRLSPEIYEGVVELRETLNGVGFVGNGRIVDYAVKMKRLPNDGMLDKLVDSGRADAALMRNIATVIASFHSKVPTSSGIALNGQPERIMFNWQENFQQMLQFENILPADGREFIRSYVEQFMKNRQQLFLKRIEDGRIRECDGDIHIGNICLQNGTVYIFDCIEFNERFRCCDTASDTAFLLMDLDYHGRNDLSEVVWGEYLTLTGDTEALPLINFYKIYRAFVRGKIESLIFSDSTTTAVEREVAAERAKRYFSLVSGYIVKERLKQTLFITCGVMGVGKSTLSEKMAYQLGISRFSSDIIRKEISGISSDEMVKVSFNTGLYSSAQSSVTYCELLKRAEEQLKSGKSVIVDASFIYRHQRALFRELSRECGVNFVILNLECRASEQKHRLQKRQNHRTASDGRIELMLHQREVYEPPSSEEGELITLESSVSTENLITDVFNRVAV